MKKLISLFSTFALFSLIFAAFVLPAAAQETMNIDGSKLKVMIGDTVVCDYDTSVSGAEITELWGEKLGKVYSASEYDIYVLTNDEKKAEKVYLFPTCKDGVLDIPGIYAEGSGAFDVIIVSSLRGENFDDRRITINLNAFTEGSPYAGYAFYSKLDEEQRSSKSKLAFTDGALLADDRTGEISASSVNINGTVLATHFSSDDVRAITFGTDSKPVDYAFEFTYNQDFAEWDSEEYFEIEIKEAIVTAYVNKSFMKDGKLLRGNDYVPNNYASLWVYDSGAVIVYDKSADNDSKNLLGNVDTVRVLSGGTIDLYGEATTAEAIALPQNIKAGYYSSYGSYRKVDRLGGRITESKTEVNCIEDKNAEGYDATSNPTPNKDKEGRYSFVKSDSRVTLKSTSKSLGIMGISQEIENGHFEIEAGSGLMEDDGTFWAEEGTEVKFTLVPDSGYQYKAGTFSTNGFPVGDNNTLFKKTDDLGVYVYTMGANACTITCEFEPASNEVNADKADAVTGASIDMKDNSLIGSMEFTVSDSTAKADKSKINKEAGDYTVGTVVDLKLDQKVNTVTGEDAWTNNITQLDSNMSVSLKVDSSIAGKTDYEVIRVHEGKAEVLDAKYDSKKKQVTFETDCFSTYAIVYKESHVHKYSEAWSSDGKYHWHECECGAKTDKKAHTTTKKVTKATTKKDGSIKTTCSVCKKVTAEKTLAKVTSVSLSQTEVVYNGKAAKVTVKVLDKNGKEISSSYYNVTVPNGRKKIGEYKYKVVLKGRYYSGTLYGTLTVTPDTPTKVKASQSTKTKTASVTWKQGTVAAEGYEITYKVTTKKGTQTKTVTQAAKKGTTLSIKKSAKSDKISNVKVRSYVTVNGKKIYSAWSK